MASNNETKQISISFRGETKNFQDSVNVMDKLIKAARKDITELNKQLKFDKYDTSKLNGKLQDLNTILEANKERANLLKGAIEELERKNNGVITGKTINEWKSYQASLSEVNTEAEKVNHQMAELKNYIDNIGTFKAADKLEKLGNNFGKLGNSLVNFSKYSGLVSGGADFLKTNSLKAARDFESAFTGVMKTVDETATTTYADLTQSIRRMAQEVPSSTTEIASVMEMAGQLGVKADDIERFTKVMIDLSNATNIDATEGAAQLAQYFNIMQADLKEVDKFGAALTDLGNNAATTEADILRMAQNLAGIGKTIGLSNQDVLALSTTLNSVGLTAEKGGNAISTIITRINKIVGTDKVATWAKVAGMEVEDFNKLWVDTPIDAIKEIVGGLASYRGENENLSQELEALDIKNIRQIDTMTRLTNAYKLFDGFIERANDAWDENSALTEEASRRYATTDSQIQILKNTVNDLYITLGEAMLPVIKDLIDDVKPFVKGITNWVSENKELASSLVVVLSKMSPFTLALGKGANGIAKLATKTSEYMRKAAEAGKATNLLSALLGSGGAGLVVGIGAAIVGFTALMIKMKQQNDQIYQMKKGIKEYNDKVKELEQSNQVQLQTTLQSIEKSKIYASTVDDLVEKLKTLNPEEDEYTETKKALKKQIELVNTAAGESIIVFDEENGVVRDMDGNIVNAEKHAKELSDTLKKNAWENVNRGRYEAAMQQEQEITTQLNDLYGNLYEKFSNAQKTLGIEFELPDFSQLGYSELPNYFDTIFRELDLVSKGFTDEQIGTFGQVREAAMTYARALEEGKPVLQEVIDFQKQYEGVVDGTINSTQLLRSELGLIDGEYDKNIAKLEEEKKRRTDLIGTTEAETDKRIQEINSLIVQEQKYKDEAVKLKEEEEKQKENLEKFYAQEAEKITSVKISNIDRLYREWKLPVKYVDIYPRYHDYGSGGFGSPTLPNGTNYNGGSGGFGNMNVYSTINVSNNGQNISYSDVEEWGRQIANVVNKELGRKLAL